MSIDQILQTAQGLTGNANRSFQVLSDDQFRSTLTVGQIIKGKVLRHYEGTKYQVEFSGQERIVDSKIILLEGSTVRGRVTEITDKVIVQRIADKEVATPLENKDYYKNDIELTQLVRFLESVNLNLNVAQQNNLLKLMRSSSDRQLSLMASMLVLRNGLVLSKNSLVIAEDALREVRLKLPSDLLENGVMLLLSNKSDLDVAENTIPMLAEYLKKILISEWHVNFRKLITDKASEEEGQADVTSKSKGDSSGTDSFTLRSDKSYDDFNLSTWLMNAQVDGSIAHRIATLPMWVGGKIIEFDIAMFSQKERNNKGQSDTKYQKIVLSLETINLGRVNVTANIVDSHLKVNFTGDDEGKMTVLAEHSDELHQRLGVSDWIVDEIKYQEKHEGSDSPVSVVAEHIIRQDSLSRLM